MQDVKSRYNNVHNAIKGTSETRFTSRGSNEENTLEILRNHLTKTGFGEVDQFKITQLCPGFSTLTPYRVSIPDRELFAKVGFSLKQRKQLQHEALWAQVAASLNIAPRLLNTSSGVNVAEFISAAQMDPVLWSDDESILRAFSSLVGWHKAKDSICFQSSELTALSPEKRVRISLSHAKRLGRITHAESKFVEVEVERAAESLASLKRPLVPTHGDFITANILLGPTRAWLIDFEHAGFGEAMTDLAHFAAELRLSITDLPRLANLYCKLSLDDFYSTLASLELCYHIYSLWKLLSLIKRNTPEDTVVYWWERANENSKRIRLFEKQLAATSR